MSADRPLTSIGGNPPLRRLILGSRGSALARAQTAMVAERLERSWPGLEIAIQIISTRGDQRTSEALDPRAGRKGLFTLEIERALAAGEIDAAVHSAKDLPSEMTAGLELGAVLPRASVEDVLIRNRAGKTKGAIATGSVRRQHQLRWMEPEVEVIDLRGNVPTRLRKFLESDWQGIILARAGLDRLGYDLTGGSFEFEGVTLHAEILSPDVFVPAGGQGIIAVQVRGDDRVTKSVVDAICDRDAWHCLEGEREFLRLLQGDCGSPVGVLATVSGVMLAMRAQIFEPGRVEPRMARVEGEASAARELGRQLWGAING